MRNEKKIPTILGLLFLLASITIGIIWTKSNKNISSKASSVCKPDNLQITNITHHSFDISFVTVDSCLSIVSVDNRTVNDIRFVNTNTESTPSKIHYFQIDNLKEKTFYPFTLINNGSSINKPDYKVETATKPTSSVPTSNLAWGRVFNPDLKPATDAIVYLNITGSAPLSSFITSSGHWNISLANSFNDQKSDWFTPQNNQDEDIVVISSGNLATTISSNTSRNNPVPDIIIGQNSFSSTPVDTTGSFNSNNSISSDINLQIKNPTENEVITTQKPDFFGTAPIDSLLEIKIESEVIVNGTSTSSSDGSWHWSPPEDLSPGEHTITVSINNPKTGLKEQVSRKFKVLAQDNNLAFSASSSAITKTTPSPTLIPTQVVTATPTPTLQPTAPISSSSAARTSKPSTESGIPKTAFALPTFLLIGTALILLISAVFL